MFVVATGLGETVKRQKPTMVDLSSIKKAEAPTEAKVVETKSNVSDFATAAASKRERDEEVDEYANLEIPAFCAVRSTESNGWTRLWARAKTRLCGRKRRRQRILAALVAR